MGRQRLNSANLAVWHGGCKLPDVPGRAGVQGYKRTNTMSFSTINNAFAAVAAFAISAIVMAAAIVPASPAGFIA